MDISKHQEFLTHLINEGEKEQAVKLLSDLAEQYSFKTVIFSVLEPMLVIWGRRWMQGKLSLAHGYLSGKVAEEFYLLAANNPEFKNNSLSHKGTIVIGNAEDDFHPLGRNLVNIYSKAVGWNMVDLGTDVSAEIFVEKAIENNADIIAVSAMMFTTAKNISKIRDEIDKNGLTHKVMLAVGGAVFKLRPELVTEFGGNGTADNAIDAPELFDSLLKMKKV